jgi:hypothetical protein
MPPRHAGRPQWIGAQAPRSPATSPAQYLAGSGVGVSVLFRQPQSFECVLPLLVQRDPLDCSVADRPNKGGTSHRLDSVTPPAVHRPRNHYGGEVVRIPSDDALRLLRQQVGRCPVCGFDLDLHTGGKPCPEPTPDADPRVRLVSRRMARSPGTAAFRAKEQWVRPGAAVSGRDVAQSLACAGKERVLRAGLVHQSLGLR